MRNSSAWLALTALLVGSAAAQPQSAPPANEVIAASTVHSGSVRVFSLTLPDDDAESAHVVRHRNRWIVGASTAALLYYGKTRWWPEGFDSRFKNENEGWFSRSTRFGGIDKLGHAYANYAGVRLLTPTLEAVGNPREDALMLALAGTLGAFAVVEIIDGYSREQRFSAQDLWSDVAGALAGVALERSPRLDALVDLRFGYRREGTSNHGNPFGDYEGQRFFLVLKADGVPALRTTRLTRYLELSVGYGVRGFDTGVVPAPPRQFERYVGISLNLSALLADTVYGGRRGSTRRQRNLDRAFELFQLSPGAWHQSLY